MDSSDALRYGLYAITVLLGLALLLWMWRSRKIHLRNLELLRNAERAAKQPRHSGPRVRAVRGMPTARSIAAAIAGIRLPAHWQPDPAVEISSPLTLTTDRETAGEVATLLSDELVRLGYRIHPTGPRSALATRASETISIEVEAPQPDSLVMSRLTLVPAGRG